MEDDLKKMLAGLMPITASLSDVDEAFDYVTAAVFLRYEKILAPAVQNVLDTHVMPIVTKEAARKARDGYTRSYLLQLEIPYTGIQTLCTELIRAFQKFSITPTDIQMQFAAGKFDWKDEYEQLSSMNSI